MYKDDEEEKKTGNDKIIYNIKNVKASHTKH